jgi:hypothetical protein
MSRMRCHSAGRLVGLVVLLGAFAVRRSAAQVSFAWPSDTGDVARYTTVEECLAATERVRSRLASWRPVWSDTLPLTPERAGAPLPSAVIETARRCSARFSATTAPVTDFAPLQRLYLLADRDVDALTILRRRLAAVAPRALRERAAVLDSALEGYLSNSFGAPGNPPRPVRLATAESLLAEAEHIPDSLRPIQARMTPAFQLLREAKNAGDTSMVRRVAQRYIDIITRASPADRRTSFYQAYASISRYVALVTMDETALLDSLRHSTASYVALKRAMWAKASGERPEALHFPIGQLAPPVEGTFWFGRGDSSAPRPTKGKIGLVVYLDYGCRQMSNAQCWPAYASLRRLAQRFPALEVTIMARTHGFFSGMAPPTPAEEAQALHEWWQEFHHLPGALSVTATEFWRLPAPDRRRIDRSTVNETRYSFGRSWELEPGMAFLVDRDGTIVEVGELGLKDSWGIPDVETHLTRLLEILFQRQTAHGST